MTQSRYKDCERLCLTQADGTEVRYFARRFVPPPQAIPARGTLRAQPQERTDILAWRGLQDPLLFWRIADANGVLDARDLVSVPGATVRIPQDPI